MGERTHHVYVCHFGDGVVGYIGYTSRPAHERIAEHRTKEWWPLVTNWLVLSSHTHARVAKAVERALIRVYRPPGNTADNPDGPDLTGIRKALDAQGRTVSTGGAVSRVQTLWDRAADGANLSRRVNGTIHRPRIRRPQRVTPSVVRFDYHAALGTSVDDLANATTELAAALHVHRVGYERLAPDQAHLYVVVADPMPDTHPFTPPTVTKAGRWRIGRTDTDKPVVYDLRDAHTLFAGTTRSGKSNWERVIVAGAATHDQLVIVGIDPKRTELSMWRSRLTYLAIDDADIVTALDATVAEMKRRQRWMEQHNYADLNDAWADPAAPDDTPAPYLLVVDEMANLFLNKHLRTHAVPPFKKLLSESAAAGIRIVAATQAPHERIIDTDARQNFSTRIGGATEGPNQTATIFGHDAATQAPCHLLPLRRGHAYIKHAGGGPITLAAGDYFPPHMVTRYAEHTARWKPPLTLTPQGLQPTPNTQLELPDTTPPQPEQPASPPLAASPVSPSIRGGSGGAVGGGSAGCVPVVVGDSVGEWVVRVAGLRGVPKVRVPVGHPLRVGGGEVGVHRVLAFELWGGGDRVCGVCGVVVRWVERPVGRRRVNVDGELVVGRRDGVRQNIAPENLIALCVSCSRKGGFVAAKG